MSYLVIDDFKLGMDRRKERIAGVAGALWEGINGHINRGGSFERRKKFVLKYALPAGKTFGMAQLNTQLFVFGSGTNPGVPAGVSYQQLAHPNGMDMVEILDVTTFGGKIYVVARYSNGDIYHYYDGSRVTSWDATAVAIASNSSIASALKARINLDPRYLVSAIGAVVTIVAANAGTPFTIAATAVDGGGNPDQTLTLATVQANVSEVAETPATMTFDIIDLPSDFQGFLIEISINGHGYHFTSNWQGNTDPQVVAQRLVNAINASGTDFQAVVGLSGITSLNTQITITAKAGLGSLSNTGFLFFQYLTNSSGISYAVNGAVFNRPYSGSVQNVQHNNAMSGGVDMTAAVAQVVTATVGGTFEGSDIFTLTIDGVAYVTTGRASGMGITAFTYNQRVWSVTTSLVEYCSLNDPTTWGGSGTSGSINITNQDAGNDPLVGLQQYQNKIAIYTESNIQIWILAVDPSQNTFQQSVQGTGARSNKSIRPYGNIDVFYYDTSGVRSLRARDASNFPAVNDVGVAIDPFIQQYVKTLTGSQIARSTSVTEPVDGRFWQSFANRIFTYSFFPGSKISAWTYYDLVDEIGNVDITEMVRSRDRVYLRAGDNIYLYGGDSGAVYPNDNEITATANLPFLTASKLGTVKGIKGFDLGISNQWKADLLPLPQDDTVTIPIGTFANPTYNLTDNPISLPTKMFALNMTCNKAGPATISNMCIYFDFEDE